ncbi:hypothetical protein V5E97_37605 [Singulisphaera sp. Ch08]|uniref:Uncharacterized protein n=1 Tax=Singulisphaera sp. Ch08 TaxID=3120278 RepID=A0AAU7CFQ0_9BACT
MDTSGEVYDSPAFGRLYGLNAQRFDEYFVVNVALDEGGRFRAVTAFGTFPVDHPDIERGHRFSKGSWWSTSDLARYPKPPFLLTDDTTFHLVYHGTVTLLPVQDMADMIRGQSEYYGEYDIPIVANRWFGMVRVVDRDTDHAQLWAFSNQELTLSERIDDLRCASGNDGDEFGSIVIPPDVCEPAK